MTNSTTTFPQTYQVQFNFHFDVTQRFLELARALPEEAYHAKSGYSQESIHNTFCHTVGAATFWREVMTNMLAPDSDPFEPVAIANVDALAEKLESERKRWAELLAMLDDASLFETFECQFPGGPPLVLAKWQTLQHVILHGMQHQAELARLFTEAGHSPGDMDFLLYPESV